MPGSIASSFDHDWEVGDQNDGCRERHRIGFDGDAGSALRRNFLAQHRGAERQPRLRIGGELPGFDDDESGTGAHQLSGQQRRATGGIAPDFADEIGCGRSSRRDHAVRLGRITGIDGFAPKYRDRCKRAGGDACRGRRQKRFLYGAERGDRGRVVLDAFFIDPRPGRTALSAVCLISASYFSQASN